MSKPKTTLSERIAAADSMPSMPTEGDVQEWCKQWEPLTIICWAYLRGGGVSFCIDFPDYKYPAGIRDGLWDQFGIKHEANMALLNGGMRRSFSRSR